MGENVHREQIGQVSVQQILGDPAASVWIKTALQWALARDPVDAANDAEVLAEVLRRRCEEVLGDGTQYR